MILTEIGNKQKCKWTVNQCSQTLMKFKHTSIAYVIVMTADVRACGLTFCFMSHNKNKSE